MCLRSDRVTSDKYSSSQTSFESVPLLWWPKSASGLTITVLSWHWSWIKLLFSIALILRTWLTKSPSKHSTLTVKEEHINSFRAELNAASYNMLLQLCQQFVFVSFLFQHDTSPMLKASLIKKCFSQVGLEELDPNHVLANIPVSEWDQTPAKAENTQLL